MRNLLGLEAADNRRIRNLPHFEGGILANERRLENGKKRRGNEKNVPQDETEVKDEPAIGTCTNKGWRGKANFMWATYRSGGMARDLGAWVPDQRDQIVV